MPESLPLSEAASRLGISVDAVRKKIRRGTITATKRDGRWYVDVPDLDAVLDASMPVSSTTVDSDHAASMPPVDDGISRELVSMLRAELDALHRELSQAATERAELRRLLALALQRPALPEGQYEAHEHETEQFPRCHHTTRREAYRHHAGASCTLFVAGCWERSRRIVQPRRRRRKSSGSPAFAMNGFRPAS